MTPQEAIEGFFRTLFGYSEDECWDRLAQATGGERFYGGDWGATRMLRVHSGRHTVVLDYPRVLRFRVALINPSGYRFLLGRGSGTDRLDWNLGPDCPPVSGARIGWLAGLRTRASDPALVGRVVELLDAQQAVLAYRPFSLRVSPLTRDANRPGSPGSPSLLTLRVTAPLAVSEWVVALIRLVTDLAGEIEGVEGDAQPGPEHLVAALDAVREPVADEGTPLWDRELVAADAIARLRSARIPQAVPALMRALDNPLPSIRISATEALGSLGVAEAAEPLLERLGSPLPEERAAAFAALEALGAADGARSIQALLSGGDTVPPMLPDELARGLRAAAGLALADAELSRVARAARVLEALGATDALPEIRTAMRRFTGDRNPLRADMLAAIRGLEQYAALPRVPARVPSETDSLPLPARCSPTAQGLPVPARAPSDGKAPDRV